MLVNWALIYSGIVLVGLFLVFTFTSVSCMLEAQLSNLHSIFPQSQAFTASTLGKRQWAWLIVSCWPSDEGHLTCSINGSCVLILQLCTTSEKVKMFSCQVCFLLQSYSSKIMDGLSRKNWNTLKKGLANYDSISNYGPCPCQCNLPVKNVFLSLEWLKEKLKKIIFYDMWKICEIQISAPINKALLEFSHGYSFMQCLELFLHYRS